MKLRRLVLTYWVVAVSLFIPSLSYAYIDPATTTYIIQIITALVITLGVTMSIAFYKIKMLGLNVRFFLFGLKHKLFSKKQREADNAERKAIINAEKSAQENASENESSGNIGVLIYGIPKARSEYAGVVPLTEDDVQEEPVPVRKGFSRVIHFLFHDNKGILKRIAMSALVAAVLPFTVIIFGILDLIISNQDIVIFSYKVILSEILQLALNYFLVLFVPLVIFRGKVFDFLLSIVLGISVATYLQGTFMNIDLGQLTGDAIIWSDYLVEGVITSIIWLLIVAAVFFLRFLSSKNWARVCMILPALIIVVQLVALFSIIPANESKQIHPKTSPQIISRLADEVGMDYEEPEKKAPGKENGKPEKKGEKKVAHSGKPALPHEIIEARYGVLKPGEEYSLTVEGIYDVSSSENVFFFILDRLDMQYINEVLAEDPTFFDKLDGFTMFKNNISHYSRTFASVASTLTERIHLFDIPATQYFSEAYSESRFLPEIQDLGFTTKLYMERPYTYTSTDQLFGMADNIGPIKFNVRKKRSLDKLKQLSYFRYAPHFAKKQFSLSPHEFGKMRKAVAASGLEPYITDDVLFYEELVKKKLKVTSDKKNFALYHLQGPHTPHTMTEDIRRVPNGESDIIGQTKGSFNIVYEFMNQLKELGLYEDATIIITGDHGRSYNYIPLDHSILTGLYVKPSGSAGKPLEYNNAPVNPNNLRATIIEAMGGNASSYGTPYFDVSEDDQTVRKYYYRLNEDSNHGPLLEEFDVRGDANDFRNWTKVRDIAIKYWFG